MTKTFSIPSGQLALSLHASMLSPNFLTVNLSATLEPPVSIDGMENEAIVSLLQDDGTLRKEEGDACTGCTRIHAQDTSTLTFPN